MICLSKEMGSLSYYQITVKVKTLQNRSGVVKKFLMCFMMYNISTT